MGRLKWKHEPWLPDGETSRATELLGLRSSGRSTLAPCPPPARRPSPAFSMCVTPTTAAPGLGATLERAQNCWPDSPPSPLASSGCRPGPRSSGSGLDAGFRAERSARHHATRWPPRDAFRSSECFTCVNSFHPYSDPVGGHHRFQIVQVTREAHVKQLPQGFLGGKWQGQNSHPGGLRAELLVLSMQASSLR